MAKQTGRTQREQLWRKRIRQQLNSGRTIRDWCRHHKIKEASFYWWRRELARRDALAIEVEPTSAYRGCPAPTASGQRGGSVPARAQGLPGAEERAGDVRLRRQERDTAFGSAFVPVRLAAEREPGAWGDERATNLVSEDGSGGVSPRIEILLGNGCCIRLFGAIPSQRLSQVLAVVEARAC